MLLRVAADGELDCATWADMESRGAFYQGLGELALKGFQQFGNVHALRLNVLKICACFTSTWLFISAN